ncbi:MAG: hypothetical protein JWM76_25 [Pseudonocardiales bacterium]|nr:hypothetical protein [Pseudonocardiales bacterium]
MNMGVGSRYRDAVERSAAAAAELGYRLTTSIPDVAGGCYADIMDGLSLEFVTVPGEMDSEFGFVPEPLYRHGLVAPSFAPPR